MKAAPFTYVRAQSAAEAVEALVEHGDSSKILAGGQSLLAMMNLRVAQPEVLVDLGRAGLDSISVGDRLDIGAMATQNAALLSADVRDRAPLMARALQHVGHHTLRNRGTVGGSIVHADPAAELPAVLLVLDAELVALGPDGSREISADDFFVSHFTTDLAEDEVLVSVRIKPTPRQSFAFYEVSRRHGDYPMAGMAASLALNDRGEVADARIALFAVDARPLRVPDAEAALVGHRLGDEHAIEEATEAAIEAANPPSDLHGSASYRKRLAGVAVRRGLQDAAERTHE